jgi:chromosome segregation ATPase
MKKNGISEISQLKVDLRNKTSMYNNAKNRISILKDENKNLKDENKKLLDIISSQKEEIERKQNTIDEYSRMIFRPKNKKKLDHTEPKSEDNKDNKDNIKIERSKESYKRKIPELNQITNTIETYIQVCPVCKTPLKNIKKIERYVEDISIRDIKPTVTKYVIHS